MRIAHQMLVTDEALEDVTASLSSELGDLGGMCEKRGKDLSKGGEIRRILEQQTGSGSDLLSDPADREASTALDFHMPSATVSPKPSARLFCTITVAWRCRAFTMAAFSSTSSIGKVTSRTRSRASEGSASQAVTHAVKTSAPSGSSVTPAVEGPTSARWASACPTT